MPAKAQRKRASRATAATPVAVDAPKGPKVAHWTSFNKSGMNRVAESIVAAERRLGINSVLCNVQDDADWSFTFDADVHVAHTHPPESYKGKSFARQLSKPPKWVWVGHGTPEHVFYEAVQAGKTGGYGHGDPWMLMQYWLQNADARVTFWPRHAAIYRTMVDKGTPIHLLPLGVDKEFWSGGASQGKYAGTPSVWSGENCHQIKWPLDLLLMWPWIYKELDGASLHLNYLPQDVHRWFFTLANRNGASYGAHITPLLFSHESLRNIFKSIDFFAGLVRYGDFNRLSLEANAAGAATISYPGNPYSTYWIPEGDQREAAKAMLTILKGDAKPRTDKQEVPDFLDMARGMQKIYEGLL